jgi:uncharacterized membrane protein
MYAVGGLCFVVIGGINNWIPWGMPLPLQGVTGALAVTVAELASGMILNVWLGLAIWDYSAMPYNLLGQICLPFSAAWAALSLVAIWLDDLLRHYLFGEDKPRYNWWIKARGGNLK